MSFGAPPLTTLVYAHDEKKADVLDFMFEETRTLVFDNKPGCVCSVHPCSLVEAKIADHAKLLRNFPISLPVRYTNFEHWACDDLLHLVGKKPRPKKTPASTVVLLRQVVPPHGMSLHMIPLGLLTLLLPLLRSVRRERTCLFVDSTTCSRCAILSSGVASGTLASVRRW